MQRIVLYEGRRGSMDGLLRMSYGKGRGRLASDLAM